MCCLLCILYDILQSVKSPPKCISGTLDLTIFLEPPRCFSRLLCVLGLSPPRFLTLTPPLSEMGVETFVFVEIPRDRNDFR